MAQHYRDFSEYSLGADPHTVDWDLAFRTGFSTPTFEVVADALGPAGRALRIIGGSNSLIFSWLPEINTGLDNVEVYIEHRTVTGDQVQAEHVLGGAAYLKNVVDGSNELDVGDGYWGGQSNFDATRYVRRVYRYTDGVLTSLANSGSITLTEGLAGWCYLFQCFPEGADTRIRWKEWKIGEAEPGTWNLTVLNNVVTQTGFAGWAKDRFGTESRILFFGAGTGGDAAPRAPVADKTITGDVSIHADASAVLTRGRGVIGDVAVHAGVSALLELGGSSERTIIGSVAVHADASALLTRGRTVVGSVDVHADVSAVFTHGRSVVGDVSIPIEVSSVLEWTPAIGLLTGKFKNKTGTVLANQTGVIVDVYSRVTGELVVRITSQTTTEAGRIRVNHPSLVEDTEYKINYELPDGSPGVEYLTAT